MADRPVGGRDVGKWSLIVRRKRGFTLIHPSWFTWFTSIKLMWFSHVRKQCVSSSHTVYALAIDLKRKRNVNNRETYIPMYVGKLVFAYAFWIRNRNTFFIVYWNWYTFPPRHVKVKLTNSPSWLVHLHSCKTLIFVPSFRFWVISRLDLFGFNSFLILLLIIWLMFEWSLWMNICFDTFQNLI